MGQTHPEITVHAQKPHHRRKAGSGPPASALIAWLSTDPYLRDAATTVSHRREIAVPLLFETRSAKAAAAVCFVLACAALVGITEIVSHGRAVAQDTIATAPRRLPATQPDATAGKLPDPSTAAGERKGGRPRPGPAVPSTRAPLRVMVGG